VLSSVQVNGLKAVEPGRMVCGICESIEQHKNALCCLKILDPKTCDIEWVKGKLAQSLMSISMECRDYKVEILVTCLLSDGTFGYCG
jgi:hypothetical protein